MKSLKRISLLMTLLFVCTSSFAQVKSDYDKSTDFSKYKSYTFAGWEKNSDQLVNDFDKKRVLEALKKEFSARGMSHVESEADAVITLYLVVNNKTSTTAYTDFNGGMGYGYGMRRAWGWGMGPGMVSATTTYDEDDYKEGTLVVDLYDAAGKSLVWQGVMTKVINEHSEKRDKTIPKNIKKLMKKFPVKPMK
ncbi:DUF4136 domain-containing protein [Tamlana sp. 2_MG-2023]|uniref:DUF4136 domain-containing protein n=1 Tax=unclassified Tamlana TaxID=2614803 RepID=UPI0026E40ABB|nr:MULTISPECIES: DUF4136 domain-containing protein [unclassified Tamlana]MDO6760989.1 DUF4136 domain-containing protein [Tamlana sp. 2_MG-2023]MDO6791245.1 DUF4136 domain-containing protein [Tamlana sp. 1_MG-2023]